MIAASRKGVRRLLSFHFCKLRHPFCFFARSQVRAPLLGLLLGVLAALAPACRHREPPKPYTAYVVNHQSATLAAVNLANFHVTGTLALAAQPERVLARPGIRQLYVVSRTGKSNK